MNYRSILEIAIAAARRAGEVLRNDFYRPAGPRGSGEHAEADEVAEAAIRACLREATPDFGMVGEELSQENREPRDPAKHLWLIDPNDGTVAYLKGYRGSAVSIGLLRAGQPVLGVVYAFAALHGGDDLIAWAEGETLTRNGQEVVHPGWAEALESQHTVLVSQSADRNSEANLRCVAPARFRPMPSIAYRLALTAVGEAQAAVSLNGPCGWDYAGGHALLRGAGGELFDTNGQVIRYRIDGTSNCRGKCFGGSPTVCATLAKSEWSSVFRPAQQRPGEFGWIWPRPDRIVADSQLLSRAQGCLMGQLAGDSLGGLVEFSSPKQICQRYPNGIRTLEDGGHWGTIAGQPTDDSELALMLARSLLHTGSFDLAAIARAYVSWYESGPFDIGNTIGHALSSATQGIRNGAEPSAMAIEAASRQSQSNGSLMRVSPLGIFGHGRPLRELVNWARSDASLTHGHPLCQDAAATLVIAIQGALVTGCSPKDVFERTLEGARQANLHSEVIATLEAARHNKPVDYVHQMGWVNIAMQNAFYQLLHSESLEDGVVDTIMQGGDTDTNAAIAGALLGAVHGISEIPFQWQDRVLTCRPIAGLTGTRHPRPRQFWPVDALLLAEHLLLADSCEP